jgi:rRNA maturation endonuclease Nob1
MDGASMSQPLDVTDWKVRTCPGCERITKIVHGTCERCGRVLWEDGGGNDE